jgi:pyruvate-formate lyase-activating enzyme
MKDRHQKRKRSNSIGKNYITALVANRVGEIFELEGFAAMGMAGKEFAPLLKNNTVGLPHGSELMFLPDRSPILFNLASKTHEVVTENPVEPGEPVFPVAAFNSPGFVNAYVPAYEEKTNAGSLPLFSYAAVGWHGDGFRSAVFQVDKEPRQDLRRMPLEKVRNGVLALKKKFPRNRLAKHLEKCALTYGCPAAKNFFIGRYEAPLPTSSKCNARCLGCLSLQSAKEISHCQDRIAFIPSADEIAEIALSHLARVKNGVVSFGQGCEGDPLLAAEVIGPAIELIRKRISHGTINMNTNGSLPDVLKRLFDAGLDSIRVSLNSVREPCYDAYFRPKGYCFSDVLKSIELGIEQGRHVAINYLNMAGFTDTPEEKTALMQFLETYPINQIQWRNLNFDPIRYWRVMDTAAHHSPKEGMKDLVNQVKTKFPHIRHGYFNPYVRALPSK